MTLLADTKSRRGRLAAMFCGLGLVAAQIASAGAEDEALRTNCYSGRKYGYDAKTIISACEALLKGSPSAQSQADIYNTMGLAAETKPDYDSALKYFDTALKLVPNYRYPLQNKADALMSLDRCAEAYPLYEQRSKISEDSYSGTFGLGESLACQGKIAESIKFFDEALIEAPHVEGYYRSRARSLLAIGESKKAIEDAEACARLNPIEPSYLYQTAVIAYAANDSTVAATYVEKYLKASPNEAYGVLLRYLISLQKKTPDPKPLQARIAQISDSRGWFRQLAGFVLGEISESALLPGTKGGTTPADEQSRLLDLYFYSGELKLANGDKSGAIEKFKLASQTTGNRGYSEYWASLGRLKQLGAR